MSYPGAIQSAIRPVVIRLDRIRTTKSCVPLGDLVLRVSVARAGERAPAPLQRREITRVLSDFPTGRVGVSLRLLETPLEI